MGGDTPCETKITCGKENVKGAKTERPGQSVERHHKSKGNEFRPQGDNLTLRLRFLEGFERGAKKKKNVWWSATGHLAKWGAPTNIRGGGHNIKESAETRAETSDR